jgi:hypothetical protein
MSLVVVTSAVRSPGTTTCALGFALCWPGPVLLADLDRQPGQGVLAGFLQGRDPAGGGLLAVLAAHRERRPLGPAIGAAALDLVPSEPRGFLPGFAHPGMVDLFATAWPALAASLAAREEDVVVDAGRIGTAGLPTALTEVADAIVVVSRTGLVDLVGLRLYLPLVTEAAGAERVSLLLVGPGRPYQATEIGAQFRLALEEPVPWAPAEAAVWSEGEPPGRRFARSGYLRAVRRCSEALAERLHHSRALIGAPR